MKSLRAFARTLSLVVAALAAATPANASPTIIPNVAAIAVVASSPTPVGAPEVGTPLGGERAYLAAQVVAAPAAPPAPVYHGPDFAAIGDSVNTPSCKAGARRLFYVAAALQIVDSLVVTAANVHNATQRVAPYGQFTNPAVPLLELAVQDAVVSTALGATHASCRARATTWFAFGGAAAYNAFTTTSGGAR